MTHATRSNREQALEYLEGDDATMNDSTCEAFYRKAFSIPDDEEVELEAIENWLAFGKAGRP